MRHTLKSIPVRRVAAGLLTLTGIALSAPQAAVAATQAERTDAVENVLDNETQCQDLGSFYWEIGDLNGTLESGRRGFLAPTENTKMAVASAGKWVYSAYVTQARNGQLTQQDILPLSMRGDYIDWTVCSLLNNTVGRCFQHADNDVSRFEDGNPDNDNASGQFNYQGSQLQYHASEVMQLANATRSQFADEMHNYIDDDIEFTYNVPSPAAGMRTNAASYAIFLRELLSGTLLLGNQLGANSTDAGPNGVEDGGASPPVDFFNGEDWDYAPGHWIENDPNVGDGAFSSPGAFGFYPWIDASETYYGVLARHEISLDAFVKSSQCGRIMRDAWLNPQQYLTP